MNEKDNEKPESDRKLCNIEMENQSKNRQTETDISVEEADGSNSDSKGLSNEEPKISEDKKKQNLEFILNHDESLIKFIGGEEIVDQQNPFKKDDHKFKASKKLKFGRKPSNSKSNGNPKALVPKNDEYVTKEDVLRESKYVKTYVKNPDEYLTYDKSVLEKFSLLKQKKSSLKKPNVSSNIPTTYTNKEPPKAKIRTIVAPSRPALKFKVKTNIDSDESLYDSNEVTINVLKFDSRFKSGEFGSQDDIEDIAEMTSTDCDERDTSKEDEVDDKKTFTNTVTSNDFKEFLKRKGLSLIPNRLASPENKPSVIRRFFQAKTTNNINGTLYPTRYQTCPTDKVLCPLSPSSQSDSTDSVKPLRRVIFNDQPINRNSIIRNQRNVKLSDHFNTGDERSNSSMSTEDSIESFRIRKREITYPGMVPSKIPTKMISPLQRGNQKLIPSNNMTVYGQVKNLENYSNKMHLSPYNYINLHKMKQEADSMLNKNRIILQPESRIPDDENIYDYASLRRNSSRTVYGEINHNIGGKERPRSSDKQHILNEIYNFYRRSVSFKNDKTKNNIYANTINVEQSPIKSNGLYENINSVQHNKEPNSPQLTNRTVYNYRTNIENLYAYVRNKLGGYGQNFSRSGSLPQQIIKQYPKTNPNANRDRNKLIGAFNRAENELQIIEEALDDRRRQSRGREDPRRHTLGGDMMQYVQGQGPNQQRSVDLEMGTHSLKSRKAPPMRSYTPSNQGPLFDDDPGIMSEVETASTGFRRGGKQRSSLPVVRTPSKTLERPLGLVFLQYRSETKRALLPNEITSIDTVRALFVRSFPRQLTLMYLEGPNVKIYIHDSSKDMFYELEDVRSHLREIRDRSVLRLFESNEVGAPQLMTSGMPCSIPQQLPPTTNIGWDQDQSYFSEPEFDSEYQHQHIHKSKSGKVPYYGSQTLPRGMYSDRNKAAVGFPNQDDQDDRGSIRGPYEEEPYYSQYGSRSNVAPIIDEEQCDAAIPEDQYAVYSTKSLGRIPRHSNQIYDAARPEDLHRMRVEHMERQLANLTGLVQKALIQGPPVPVIPNQNYLGVPGQYRGDKSVSFEKSVSFSDDIQGIPKSHSPQHLADSKPPKPAIKSSTLPRTSSQEKDRLKPAPPPKPLVIATSNYPQYRTDLTLAPEVYNHLRGLQKKAKDLRTEVRTLRRLAQTQAVAVREDIKDTFMKIRATLLTSNSSFLDQDDQEKIHLNREEEIYKQEVIRLEKDLGELESSVEGLRGEVINRRTRVNMAAVEDMALVLSRASKTVAELKMKFPTLQQGLRNVLASEMEKVCREETFLKDEPDRLESALRRCKKLTGTLVTLKRLASVQEQRLPVPETATTDESSNNKVNQDVHVSANKPIPSPRCLGPVSISGGIAPENALDALLDELQTFAKPPNMNNEHRPDDSTSDDSSQTLQNTTITTKFSQSQLYPSDPVSVNHSLRRLHSYPSGSDTDTSPPQPQRPAGKPPVPERNAELLSKVNNKRVPPPPPPRTSSRSPLASPTSPNMPLRMQSISEQSQYNNDNSMKDDSSGESVSSDNSQRQLALEMRHQELLKKQKQLQEQYQRLQQMSKNNIPLAPTNAEISKTLSESNLSQKSDGDSSSMTTQCKPQGPESNNGIATDIEPRSETAPSTKTTNKVYETDIL